MTKMKADKHSLALTMTTNTDGELVPLLQFPIEVVKATTDAEAKLDVVAPSGKKRVQQFVDPGANDRVLANTEVKRGVLRGDEFTEIPADAIAAITSASENHLMPALGFLERDTFLVEHGDRITGRYFLRPAVGGAKGYRMTYEALREVRKGKKVVEPARVIVTKRTARSREKLAVIYADEVRECLMLVEVAFAAALRQPDDAILAFQYAEVGDKQIDMLRTVIGGMPSGEAVLNGAQDEVLVAREALIEKALLGEPIAAPAAVEPEPEVEPDLEALLLASLKG